MFFPPFPVLPMPMETHRDDIVHKHDSDSREEFQSENVVLALILNTNPVTAEV